MKQPGQITTSEILGLLGEKDVENLQLRKALSTMQQQIEVLTKQVEKETEESPAKVEDEQSE